MEVNEQPLRADGNCTFDDFTDVIYRLVNAAWGPQWGTFCEAFPNGSDPSSLDMPVITYMLKEMRPGVIGNNQTREIKARRRAFFSDEDGAVEVMGRIFDCIVVFEVWEETNGKATRLASDFMNLLDTYLGHIKQQGIKELIFLEMNNTSDAVELRDKLVCRKMQYQLRLEQVHVVPTELIQKVTASISVGNSLSDDSIKKESIAFTKGG